MAKGIAPYPKSSYRYWPLFLIALSLMSACSKSKSVQPHTAQVPDVETFPIQNIQLKNCHFKDPAPVYSYNTPIPPNPIQCDEGVAKKVELLTASPLPNGIQFSNDELTLVGSANEKVTAESFQFYIENEAGYQILKLQLTVR